MIGFLKLNRNKLFAYKQAIDYNFVCLSIAVESTLEEDKGSKWYVTIVSGVVVLLIVVTLCVYAPCGCLWRRNRTEIDVSCPIAGSHKGMCGKCFLRSRGTTKTMTYEERPHHVTVNMISSERRNRPSSDDYSSRVSVFTLQSVL